MRIELNHNGVKNFIETNETGNTYFGEWASETMHFFNKIFREKNIPNNKNNWDYFLTKVVVPKMSTKTGVVVFND